MTLAQLSHQYAREAETIDGRIRELKSALARQNGGEETELLHRRIRELQPLLRQNRELARLTRHYYDRGSHRNAHYSL